MDIQVKGEAHGLSGGEDRGAQYGCGSASMPHGGGGGKGPFYGWLRCGGAGGNGPLNIVQENGAAGSAPTPEPPGGGGVLYSLELVCGPAAVEVMPPSCGGRSHCE